MRSLLRKSHGSLRIMLYRDTILNDFLSGIVRPR